MREMRMPKLALGDDDEMTVIEWVADEGQSIKEGDILLEVQTDKTNLEVEATAPGILVRRLVAAGDAVAPGSVIAVIDDQESVVDASKIDEFVLSLGTTHPSAPTAQRRGAQAKAEHQGSTNGPPTRQHNLEPVGIARFMLREGAVLGVPPRPRSSSGIGSSLTAVEPQATALDPSSVGGKFEVAEPSRHRQSVARAMAKSAAIPQFPVFYDMIVTAGQQRVKDLRDDGIHATLTDVLMRAVATTLRSFPVLNAWHDGERRTSFENVNLGLAIDGPDGVIAPTLFDVTRLTDDQLVAARSDIVERTRGRRLHPSDLTGATFTVSNVGALGANAVAPMLTPPQVGILGVGRLRKIGSSALITMTLVADHRAVDGADSARFLKELELTIGQLGAKQ